MRRAFLCHSSDDKEYVRIVANKLGRAQVVFDEFSFRPGQDFRDEINRHLDSASLFVFLVSRSSLDSLWCRYELDQAHLRRMAGGIEGQLALIIDHDVPYADLPPWLRNAKATIQPRPSQAARDIQGALLSLLSPELRKPFVGRQNAFQDFEMGLGVSEDRWPRLLAVSGLEGVGRRSFLGQATLNYLDLRLGPSFIVDKATGLDDIYLHALDETADLGTREHMAEELRIFNGHGLEKKAVVISERLEILCGDRYVPCFIDRGGMLDESGGYTQTMRSMLETFLARVPEGYLGLIHRRRPRFGDLSREGDVLHIALPPLSTNEVMLLFTQLVRRMGRNLVSGDVREVGDFLDGYPPAAYYAAAHVAEYGVQSLLADRSVLVDFKEKRFTRFLADLPLADAEWGILQYLVSETSVPLAALAIAVDEPQDSVALKVRSLIDKSLVLLIDDNYGVSPPIRDAIFRVRGGIGHDAYQRVLSGLIEKYWTGRSVAPPIEVVDATLHAAARSGGDFSPYKDVVRPSTLHRLAAESYNNREWTKALEYANRVIEMDESRDDARIISFKALVRLENWGGAARKLQELEERGEKKVWYLRGFMYRRKGEFGKARNAFESALRVGDHSISVYRDYADVLYQLGHLEEADQRLAVAHERDPENLHVLNLRARIQIEAGDVEPAQETLKQLDRFDLERRFIHHRRASLYASRGMLDLAEREAEIACSRAAVPEAFTLLADVQIDRGKFKQAVETLDLMRRRFGRQKHDVQVGLRCKALTRQGLWREAETVWDQLDDRTLPVHRALYMRILETKASDTTLLDRERKLAKTEAAQIASELDA